MSSFSGGRQPDRHQRRALEDAQAFAREHVGTGAGGHSGRRAAAVFDGVSTNVDGRRALTLVDLDVPLRSLTVVTGLTGVGKSAFLEHLLGRRIPDRGTVDVLGWRVVADPDDIHEGKRPIVGVVPRTAGLLSSRTVAENIAMLLLNGSGVADAEINRRVEEQLDILDLVDVAHELPGELEMGRRKLVAYARARVMGPELIIFDEPEAGMDRERGAMLFDLIESLKAEAPEVTFVVLTQDLPLACRIADPLVLFSHGSPVAAGPIPELVRSPNPHVRALVQEAAEVG